MGFYDDIILPHVIDFACGIGALIPDRQQAVAGLSGVVLEIGFGSGLNVPHYPLAVTRVLAVDPSERARHIARKRLSDARCVIEPIGLDAQRIRADTASADAALSTFTLCTIPDAERAMAEVRRILKPGGRFFFLEHGIAPDPGVARWQHRLNGIERAVAGGCNLDRDIPAIVRSAGFRVESLDTGFHRKMPRTHGYLYRGVATAE
jgi:ubiquinone/menaquinone biosynthesis C-methylase UbiE